MIDITSFITSLTHFERFLIMFIPSMLAVVAAHYIANKLYKRTNKGDKK